MEQRIIFPEQRIIFSEQRIIFSEQRIIFSEQRIIFSEHKIIFTEYLICIKLRKTSHLFGNGNNTDGLSVKSSVFEGLNPKFRV